MKVSLRPYTSPDQDAEQLAVALHRLAANQETHKHLLQRCLGGVIARYADRPAVQHVDRLIGHAREGRLGAFAVLHEGEIVGSASFLPNQPLRKWPIGRSHMQAGANVTAWMRPALANSPEEMRDVYELICEEYAMYATTRINSQERMTQAWTVEPLSTPISVRAGIAAAMEARGSGRYNGYELPPGHLIVPKGTFFIKGMRLVSDPPQSSV